jgi:hypothetical protein
LSVARAAILTIRKGLSALYNSADFVPAAMTRTNDDGEVDGVQLCCRAVRNR